VGDAGKQKMNEMDINVMECVRGRPVTNYRAIKHKSAPHRNWRGGKWRRLDQQWPPLIRTKRYLKQKIITTKAS